MNTTDPRAETVHYAGKGGMYDEPVMPDHPHRMLDRMENHAEYLVHLAHRMGMVLDRIHGPGPPEHLNKTSDACEPRSTVMWQMDKMETQARRLSNLIDTLEGSI